MAALVKEDGTLVMTSLKVSAEGARKMLAAIETPKKPTPKLIALMRAQRDRRSGK